MKICTNCRWCEPDSLGPSYNRCECPKNLIYFKDPIDGVDKVKRRHIYCETHRTHDWLTAISLRACGKRGRWFKEWHDERSNM